MIPTGIEEKLNQLLESQQELLQLQKQNSEQLKTIADLNAKIALQAQTIAEQAETIAYLKKTIFGSKSEKTKNFNIPGQLSLFGDETPEDVEIEKEITSCSITLPTALKPVRSYIAWWKVQKGTSLMS